MRVLLGAEERKATMRKIERDLESVDRILQQMDLDIRTQQPAAKARLTPRLRQFQADVITLKKDVRRLESSSANAASRADLLGDPGAAPVSSREMDQRQRILDGKRRLEESSNRIQNAQRIALESEQIGQNVLGDLHEQRQIIERADKNLYQADANVRIGHGYVTSMNRRLICMRVAVALVILVLLAAIITIIYFKYIKK